MGIGRLLLTIVLLGVTSQLQAQEISASLDRDTIFLGESALLRIDLVNPANNSRPDYSTLREQFNVLDTGTNSSLEMTNGRRRMVVQHNVLLEPKEAGQLVLPPLRVGELSTPAITLSVLERPAGTQSTDQDVFVELEATPLDPYVHSQVRLTVRLFHAPPITEGALNNDPWPAGLVVQRVGEDKTTTRMIDGKRYRVVERRFALFPERSGQIQLPSISFRGRVADPGGSSASLFSRGRRVSVASDTLSLQVRPQAPAFDGDLWLPAAELSVTESWPNGEPEFVQGEPITRKLQLRARGLLSTQLPELALPEVAGMKVYPDQPSSQTRSTPNGWADATREQTYALVPTQSGLMTLPEVRIPWWDVQANQQRVAIVPARQIEVAPGQSAALAPNLLPQLGQSDISPLGSQGQASGAASGIWPAVSAFLALLWGLTALAWWRAKQAALSPVNKEKSLEDTRQEANERQLLERIRSACEASDPSAAGQAILGLARVQSAQTVNSLRGAARLVTAEAAREQLLKLDEVMYGHDEQHWDGQSFKAILSTLKFEPGSVKASVGHAQSAALPPLYTALVMAFLGTVAAPDRAWAQCDDDQSCGCENTLLVADQIHTVNPEQPTVNAMVYSNGACDEILATGSVDALRASYPDAVEIDATGYTVIPGLIDAHGHIMNLGLGLLTVDLRDTQSTLEVLERLSDFAKDLPADAWLLGRGWDQNDWPQKAFPSRSDLDTLFPDRPVWLTRIDGHAGWANSAALAEADRDFSGQWQPEGGQIQRDGQGRATGVFIDRAMGLVTAHVPDWNESDRRRGLELALGALAEVGITGVHDAGTSQADLERFLAAEKSGDLSLRVYAMADGDQQLLRSLCEKTVHTPRVSARSVKLYADGALGSRGAALLEDYSDEPGNQGLLLQPVKNLNEQVSRAMGCGLQVNTHAIGDRGNRVVLDAYQAALSAHPGNPGRHRIEHAQVVAATDFDRFKALDLIASVQPTHATSDMYWAEDRVGPKRIRGAYAWRRMVALGIPLALGSDFPVEKINPMLGLYAAIARRDLKGWPADGWYADQVLTRLEALRGFTLDAAYAGFAESQVGSLQAGKRADFVLLNADLMAVSASDIPAIVVAATVVGGKAVYVSAGLSSNGSLMMGEKPSR
ncbi:MAG: amidohydrolase family protein [Lysobacterales bacterium]